MKYPQTTKEIGDMGEMAAANYLVGKGFQIVKRNFRCSSGEIDIIAVKGNVVRFIEVKAVSREALPNISRETNSYRPEEMVHPKKLQRIIKTAESYMNETSDEREFQIDVVGVFLDFHKKIARCRLFEQVL